MTTTPADLALDFGLSQTRVRDVLREQFGTLPAGVTRWELDDDRAAIARAHLTGAKPGPIEWGLEIGDTRRRRTIHGAYGGQRQGGISTPTQIPDILIFTDPKSGAKYGYDKFEGRREDGSYWYTGEGQYGPQTFVRGNLAIRDSAARGRTIRLFTTAGTEATYVGAFTTGEPTYRIESIPDLDGAPRDGIIFNLVPFDADMSGLPVFGGDDPPATYALSEWSPPAFADIVIGVEAQAPIAERVVSRAEMQLQSAFGEWLREQGDEPSTLRLESGGIAITPDLYVESRRWIVEAKKSIGRNYIRTAIGQVLDYAHTGRASGIEAEPVVLLPSRPDSDLLALMHSVGIIVVHRNESGFEVLSPSK